MNIQLRYVPRQWQHECHLRKARHRFLVLALHRRAGKTMFATMELVDKALRCSLEAPKFAYIAPYLKQAKAIAWAMLKRMVLPLVMAGAATIHEGELQIRFVANGASIQLYGADNPDALRGLQLDGAVLDEVAQIRPDVWVEIIQPTLADRKGWAIFIGTPAGVNLFSELFFGAEADGKTWSAARYTVYDTTALDPEEVERLRREMPESAFAREFLCDFSAAGDEQLISLATAEFAAQRVWTTADIMHAPRVLGVDVARFGNDRTVIQPRQGLQAFKPLIMHGIDNMAVAGRAAHAIQKWKPHAVFIDAGQGAGVIDRLRQLGYSPVEVHFGGKALKPLLYVDRRTEMWMEMSEWLQSGGAIPNLPGLKQELATPTYGFDDRGRRVLESKDDIKARLKSASSPDIADALALTFAAPVHVLSPIEEMARIVGRTERGEPALHSGIDAVRRGEYNPIALDP